MLYCEMTLFHGVSLGLGSVFETVPSRSGGGGPKILIRRRHPHGYRFHPSTIRDLLVYHHCCTAQKAPVPQLVFQLVAKLVQDS